MFFGNFPIVCNAVLYLSLHSLLIAYINLFQIDLKYVHIYFKSFMRINTMENLDCRFFSKQQTFVITKKAQLCFSL